MVVPLLGARKLAQIQDNLACVDHVLTGAQLSRLKQASRVPLGFPHNFLASDEIRDLVTGGTYGQIDNHRA